MTDPRTFRSGFTLTDADGHQVVAVLPCTLRFRAGAYGDHETVFRSVALDQQTIHVEEFTGGAEEVRAEVRYHGDASALRELLREGARGRTLTYYPDLATPQEAYPVALMDYGETVQLSADPGRFAYGEVAAPVTLRRVDGGSLAPLVTGNLITVGPAGPMTDATFTRATAGTIVGADRRIASIASGKRRVTWLEVNGVLRPFTLIEGARTQVAADPEAPASWTNNNTPVVTTSITDPFGGSAAIEIEDDHASDDEGKYTACSFTGDGEKVFCVLVAQGTLAAIRCQVWDDTTSAVRHEVVATWAGGAAAPSVVTSTGSGTVFDPFPVYDADGRRWWAILFTAENVVAANSNLLFVLSSGSTTLGTFYLAGGNAWDATAPTSWQGASLGTRNADQYALPWPFLPMAHTFAVRFVELAAPDFQTAGGIYPRVLTISNAANQSPRLYLAKPPGGDAYGLVHDNGVSGGSVSTELDLSPVAGDLIELIAELYADGSVQLHGRKNGGAVSSGVRSNPLGFASAWSGALLHLGGCGSAGQDGTAIGGVVARRGTGYDFEQLLRRIPALV